MPDLHDSDLYFNHRISWMRFNRRVLELVGNARHPLLERVDFLAITASNLDEFVEIRIPELERKREAGVDSIGPDGLSPAEVLDRLDAMITDFVEAQYEAFERLRGEWADEDVHLLRPEDWSEARRDWANRYFDYRISPVLSHTPVHPDHPFPRVLNEAINFLVEVEQPGESGDSPSRVVVRVPESLDAIVRFPPGDREGVYEFALLSDLVAEHVDRLFPTGDVVRSVPFRVTRDSDVGVDPEDAEQLRMALEDELMARPFGDPVRLEVPITAADEIVERLGGVFEIPPARCFRLDGPIDLTRLGGIVDRVDRPDLEYESFVPGLPEHAREPDIFEGIDDGEFVVHRPYESFEPVVELIESAASDPRVVAIKQTVYRTVRDSPITDALVRAARAGKDVTAVVELRARFDEECNVQIADRLRDAGATVVYGPDDYKVNAKLALVVRREDGTDYRYAHVGTGNYHPKMAHQYTDLGLFTDDRWVTEDVARIFEALERDDVPPPLQTMMASPKSLETEVLERIERETRHARRGDWARIQAKLNRLTDPEVIRALYRASQAGVEIDLIVRGMCRLRPGVEEVSENIRVRSIVGRFLEHSRAYYFHNGGDVEVWIASADWREKNLRSRVEAAAPIVDEDVSKRVAFEVFDTYLEDDTHAWELQSDGTYRRQTPNGDDERWAQRELLERLKHPDY
ncbi:MAG: polyphosphate kinase 1 [Bradymonadaceae bacterium]